MPANLPAFDSQHQLGTSPPVPVSLRRKEVPVTSAKIKTQPKVDISVISNASLCQLLKQKQGVGYMMDVFHIEELSNVEIHDGPELQLLAKYQEYAKVFSKQEADKLPPHQPTTMLSR
ncbi:hypothetical protein BGZ98_000734 [Dissophora globulifera]|nr:hypothetical protein BGZ98_000734 [Dissophora globulifera]